MSSSSFTSSISFTGLATGLDTESIIQQLLSIESRPLLRLQAQQLELQNRLTLYQQFSGWMQTVKSAADVLNRATAFSPVGATSSDEDVATISVSESAVPGMYSLVVGQLAQANKVLSTAQTDSSSALGLSGKFLINQTVIEITEDDSLSQIASRINNSGAGVIASVINGGSGSVYLSLTAEESGADGQLRMSNLGTDTVLDDLGFQGSSTVIREAITNGAASDYFTDATTAVGTLLSITDIPSGSLQINGTAVSVDLLTDSINEIADKINEAGISGVTASVVTTEVDDETVYQLQIVGDSATPTFVDENHILENLGILRAVPTNEVLEAQDAEFTLDGVSLTSASNTVTSVISGATITLEAAGSATLDVTRDLDAVKANITAFVDAYNRLRSFVDANSTFDSDTYESGPLFGDYTIIANLDLVTAQMTGAVEGLEDQLNSLGVIGITLGEDGQLSVNDGVLYAALNENLDEVRSLFMAVGTPSSPYVQFLSSTAATEVSPASGYSVVITQAAAKATTAAGTAQTSESTEAETLTFSGALFGSNPVEISLSVGNDIDDTIAQINNDATLGGLLTASKDAEGKLVLTADAYGSSKSFTVVSDKEASSSNSGIGTTELSATGLNVAGTINGEAATGDGQVLTGDSGNENTEGLALLITATEAGTYGSVVFTRGLGAILSNTIEALTEAETGALTEADEQIQAQIDRIYQDIEDLEESLERREESLRARFAAVEAAVAKLQAQQSSLAALMSTLTTSD
jgi:flagellar hook-associated protein 2